MKSIYFHLMPYDGLGEDFPSTHRSVWVDVPPGVVDSRRMHTLYNDYLDCLEFADAKGIDGIGVNEHHSNAYGLMASPNMMASALARRTSNSALLVMGDAVPLYNPTIRIAEELAMLDVMSGGRLIAGFPVGSSQDTNFAYGIPPATTRECYREGFELILRAWQSDEVFSFNGKYNKMRYVNPLPKPIQQPHPPVWTPGSGSLETFDFAIDHDVPYCFLSYFGADFARKNMRSFWDRVESSGLDDNPYRAGLVQLVFVADTDAEAERLYERHVQYFFQRCTHIYPGFTEAPGYKTVESLESTLPAPDAPTAKRLDSFASAQSYNWKDFIDTGIVIAGSPDTVRERLEAASKEMRIGNWIQLMHIGDMPREVAMNNIELYADKVAPGLSHLWSEYDHPWWPQPIDDADRWTPASSEPEVVTS